MAQLRDGKRSSRKSFSRQRDGHLTNRAQAHAIADTLNSGEVYLPLLLKDDGGIAHANDWASGFMRGMEFGRDDWAVLLNDRDHGGSLLAIFALANEHNPDPKMRPVTLLQRSLVIYLLHTNRQRLVLRMFDGIHKHTRA